MAGADVRVDVDAECPGQGTFGPVHHYRLKLKTLNRIKYFGELAFSRRLRDVRILKVALFSAQNSLITNICF